MPDINAFPELCQTEKMFDDLRPVFDAGQDAPENCTDEEKRAATDPYVNHILKLVGLVTKARSEDDQDLTVAAFLVDVFEDVDVTREKLVVRYGADVADLAVELADDKSLTKAERKRKQIQNASKKSVRAQILILADKTANLRTLLKSPPADWDRDRMKEYLRWSKEVVSNLSSPNAFLLAEFDKTCAQFEERMMPGVIRAWWASMKENYLPRAH